MNYKITFANRDKPSRFHQTKWSGKTEISLEELPEFVKDVGDIIFDGESVMIYNDYIE